MFSNVAAASQSDPESVRALDRALDLVKALRIPLTVLSIAEPLPAYTAFSVAADPSALRKLEGDRSAFYEEVKSRVTSRANAKGVVMTAHLIEGNTAQRIEDFVGEHGIDLLIVGLHRHALCLSSLWNTVYSLDQNLSCSVLGVH